MSTPYGQLWQNWSLDTVGLSGVSLANNTTSAASAAYLNSGASPNEVLNTECNLVFACGTVIAGSGFVVNIYRQTQAGYQAVTDNIYQFSVPGVTSTTVQSVFTLPGDEIGGFKLGVTNNSGAAATTTLYTRQSQGLSG